MAARQALARRIVVLLEARGCSEKSRWRWNLPPSRRAPKAFTNSAGIISAIGVALADGRFARSSTFGRQPEECLRHLIARANRQCDIDNENYAPVRKSLELVESSCLSMFPPRVPSRRRRPLHSVASLQAHHPSSSSFFEGRLSTFISRVSCVRPPPPVGPPSAHSERERDRCLHRRTSRSGRACPRHILQYGRRARYPQSAAHQLDQQRNAQATPTRCR